MNIQIIQEKGCFRHNRNHYVSGEIIYDVEEELAERMIRNGIAKEYSVQSVNNNIPEVISEYAHKSISKDSESVGETKSNLSESALEAIISSGTAKPTKRGRKSGSE